MENNNSGKGKAKAFLKRNVYYIIMGVCVLAIGAMITVAVLIASKDKGGEPANVGDGENTPALLDPNDGNDGNPVVTEPGDGGEVPTVVPPTPVIFAVPCNAEIARDYTVTSLIKWETLGRFSIHAGIDFVSEEDVDVVCAYNGTVKKVGYDLLNGNYVVVEHEGGLVTTYASLGTPEVTEGQTVTKGTKLGCTSTTGTGEAELGKHCHFAVTLNGVPVSPYDYFEEGYK